MEDAAEQAIWIGLAHANTVLLSTDRGLSGVRMATQTSAGPFSAVLTLTNYFLNTFSAFFNHIVI